LGISVKGLENVGYVAPAKREKERERERERTACNL